MRLGGDFQTKIINQVMTYKIHVSNYSPPSSLQNWVLNQGISQQSSAICTPRQGKTRPSDIRIEDVF